MKKKLSCLGIFFILIIFSSFAQESSAQIDFLDGDVMLYRNGKLIDGIDLHPGFSIQEADLITTGSNSFVDLSISSYLSQTIFIQIQSNTSFYFTSGKTVSDRSVTLRHLTGDISVKVNKLVYNENLNLSSRSTVMGVRGTEFLVTTSPDGSILLACIEGSVACRIVSGPERVAVAGSAVESLQGTQLRTIENPPVPLAQYKNDWFAERVRIFKAGAFSLTKPIINQYEEYEARFNQSYDELSKYEAIFAKYNNPSVTFSDSTMFTDKAMISPAIFNMRSIFFMYEELFYRLAEISKYHETSPIKGTLRRNYDIPGFMKDFEDKYLLMSEKASKTREYFRIYSQMDKANSFSGAILEEVLSNNPLFN